MKTNYLLPHYFKKIGWILFIPSALFGILELYAQGFLGSRALPFFTAVPKWEAAYIDTFGWAGMDELAVIMVAVSLLFIAFAKEKTEDEYVVKIRSESLTWAIMVNYVIIIIGTLCLYEMNYLTFIMVNTFTLLILYIIKFRTALHRSIKLSRYEE